MLIEAAPPQASAGRRIGTPAAGTGTRVALPGGLGLEVVACGLDVAPYAHDALAVLLSQAESQRAQRFIREQDRRRFVVARARLRELLGARLGVRPRDVEFAYGAHGKPALAPGGDPGLCFNVSHCGSLAVYGFAEGRAIGVDVEAVRAMRDQDDIARRFFSPRESAAYFAVAPLERPLAFFNCWTRKEAFIKAIGDGLHYPLDSFAVSLRPDEPARILRVGDKFGKDCGWQLYSFSPVRGFVSAIVVEHTNAAEWS
jgi:4'-phosphopantetheinyl transferase